MKYASRAGGVFLLGLAVGCASATPYQRMGRKGGYEDERLTRDTYFVRVATNAFSSLGLAYNYLHRRAAELCPDGYDVLDGTVSDPTTSSISSYNPATRTVTSTDVHKAEVSARIRCNTTGSAPLATNVQPEESPPQAISDTFPTHVTPTSEPVSRSPTGVGASRKLFAQELDGWMSEAKPSIRVSAEGDEWTTLILRSSACGEKKGNALSRIVGQDVLVAQLREKGFERIICRGGRYLETYDLQEPEE